MPRTIHVAHSPDSDDAFMFYALADTILVESPAHLFGFIVRGEVAKFQDDSRARAQAQRDFLAHYEAEMRAKRVEYLEHKPVVDEFKKEAEKAEGKAAE